MIETKQNIISNKQLDRIISYDNNWEQITVGDQRYYKNKLKDIYYPSVMFILSYYPKDKYFEKWLKKNGTNSDNIAKEASDKGTKIHKCIENMLKNKIQLKLIDENGYFNYTIEEWLMLMRFCEFYNTFKPKIINIEHHIFSNNHFYAGTIDLIIELNGEKWILDIKTSNNLHNVYDIQLSAYVECWNENNPNDQINKCGILWLNSKTRKESNDPNKIQGKGWTLITSERNQKDNFEIFLSIKKIFHIENPNLKPSISKYPNTLELYDNNGNL